MIRYSPKIINIFNGAVLVLCKFEGVTHAGIELNIIHCVFKNYALLNAPYKDYIFSYERLRD